MNKLLEYRVFKCKKLNRIIIASKGAVFAHMSLMKDGKKEWYVGGWICDCGEWTESDEGKKNHVVIR